MLNPFINRRWNIGLDCFNCYFGYSFTFNIWIMKAKPYLLTYIFALLSGVLLLVFTGNTNLFKGMVIVIGLLLGVSSLALVIDGLIAYRNPKASRVWNPRNMVLAGIAGIIVSVALLCMPSFFASYIVYTIGILLIILGLLQIVYASVLAAIAGINRWLYLIPWLTLIAGIVVICVGPQFLENVVTILAGIFMIIYAVNGFVQMKDNRRRISRRILEKE